LDATNSETFGYNASVALTNGTVSDDLYPVGARGVLGYGINAPTGVPANASLIPEFLSIVAPNFTIAVCGIELNHMDDPVPNGIFTMGAVDQTAFVGDFTNMTVPSNNQISWSISFDSLIYSGNGSSQSLPGLIASVDIYHSVIQVTTAMASQIYAGLPGSQALSDTVWSVPCGSSFPITLTFAGKPFTINERDTVMQLANGTCQGTVTGGAQTVGKVGAPFLRNFYTQFGAQKASDGTTSFFVGFATKIVRTPSPTVTTTLLSPTTVTATSPSNTGISASGAFELSAQDSIFLSLAVASIVGLIL